VREYLALQRRFAHLGRREAQSLQKRVDESWRTTV
jgi:pyruvate/2-oxoacid:ferredoxin oxidoreductase beta subunit